MLSGETASGNFPVESVLMMRQISEIIEEAFPYTEWRNRRQAEVAKSTNVAQAISAACCDIAEQVGARAIVSATMSGYTATQIARHRPPKPVMAVFAIRANTAEVGFGVGCGMCACARLYRYRQYD